MGSAGRREALRQRRAHTPTISKSPEASKMGACGPRDRRYSRRHRWVFRHLGYFPSSPLCRDQWDHRWHHNVRGGVDPRFQSLWRHRWWRCVYSSDRRYSSWYHRAFWWLVTFHTWDDRLERSLRRNQWHDRLERCLRRDQWLAGRRHRNLHTWDDRLERSLRRDQWHAARRHQNLHRWDDRLERSLRRNHRQRNFT